MTRRQEILLHEIEEQRKLIHDMRSDPTVTREEIADELADLHHMQAELFRTGYVAEIEA